MPDIKEKMREYLRVHNLNRSFYCQRYKVTKSAVDKWLSNQRPVPAKVQADFEKLIEKGERFEAKGGAPGEVLGDSLRLNLDEKRFNAYEKAARAAGMNIKEWLIYVIDEAAREEGFTDSGSHPGY